MKITITTSIVIFLISFFCLSTITFADTSSTKQYALQNIIPFSEMILGDINGDSKITVVDALMVLQAASGRRTLTAEQNLIADVNNDGMLTSEDALRILQFVSGRISSLGLPNTPTSTATPTVASTPTVTPTQTPIVDTPTPTSFAIYGGVLDDGFAPTPTPYTNDTAYDASKTVFVATNGTDSGPGTIDRPYATIAYAASQLRYRPGYTVFVRGGTYTNQSFLIRCEGDANDWLTFKNYNNERVILKGDGVRSGTNKTVIILYQAKYVVVDGFEITDFSGGGIQNDNSFQTIIKNCNIHDGYGGNGGSGNYNIYENNVIANCVLQNENTSSTGGWGAGLATTKIWETNTPTKNVIFRGNHVYQNWGEGMDAFMANNVVFDNNTIENNYSVNLYCDTSKNIYIVNNTIGSDNPAYNRDGYPAVALQIAMEGTNNTLSLIPQYNLSNVTIINNVMDGGITGVEFWQDSANQTATNTYDNVNIIGNTIQNISLLPFKINKVTASAAAAPSNCSIQENTIYKSTNGNYVNIGDFSAWNIRNNFWADGEPTVTTGVPPSILENGNHW